MRVSGTASGYNKIFPSGTGDDNQISLWINAGGETGVQATTEGGSAEKKIIFDINQKEIKSMSQSTENVLTIALREVDYCDKDGNEFKILVLCSEPYTT